MSEYTRRSAIVGVGSTLVVGSAAGCLGDDPGREDHRVVVHNRRDTAVNVDVLLTENGETDAVAYEYDLDAETTDESRAGTTTPDAAIVVVDGERVEKRRFSASTCASEETLRIGVVVRDDEIEVDHACAG